MRFHRLLRQARDLIREGKLGSLESIVTSWSAPRKDHDLPEWRTRKATGGGALTEIGVHHYDMWRFLLGEEIAEVFARSQDGIREDEYAVVSAETTGGILCTARVSERSPHEIEIEVCGSEGRLHIDCLRFDGLEFSSHSDYPGAMSTRARRASSFLGGLPAAMANRHRISDYRDSYRRAWDHFAQGIRANTPIDSTLLDGLRSVEITRACVASCDHGVPVRLRQQSA